MKEGDGVKLQVMNIDRYPQCYIQACDFHPEAEHNVR